MTSRERVKAFFARQAPDRVPISYKANAGIDAKLKAHFGLKPDDAMGLRQRLGVDFLNFWTGYPGPRLHPERPGMLVDADWGIRRRWVEHETGGYWDYCDFPLKEAGVEEVAAWPLPSPDQYDFSHVVESCRKYRAYGVGVGGAGVGCIINNAGFLRGMEQALVDLVTDDPAGLLLIDRRIELELALLERMIETAKGEFDFIWMGEDLGTQTSPLIGMDTFLKHIKPRHQRFLDLAKAYNLPVMIHTCGSSSWAYNEYIEMGMSAVDTLQPEAVNMSPAYLKKTFGGRLAFHGCISTAGPVSFGTVEDVIADCRRTLEIMMPGGGYAFAPTHSLQDNSPVENVVAMYETAHKFGRYA